MKNLWIFIGVIAIGFTVQATPLDDKLKSFTEAFKASSASKDANPMIAARFADMPVTLAASLTAPGGEANMASMIQQIMAVNPSPAVQETGKALLAELETRKKARVEALTAKINSVLNRVSDILMKAKNPQDLDGILGDLQKVQMPQGGRYGNDPEMQGVMNQVTSAYQFVAQWQDYLSYRNSKNNQEALNALRSLMNSRPVGDVVLVPRSEILARITALGSPEPPPSMVFQTPVPPPIDTTVQILDGIKTLDDLVPAFKALRTSTKAQGYDFLALAQMAGAYSNAQNGLPVSLDLNPSNANGQPLPEMSRIRAMLLNYLLPRYLGNRAPATKPGETPTDYLKRVIVISEEAQDWATLSQAIEAQSKLNGTPGFSPANRSFLSGLNQEIAGQYLLAVGSYQTSLQNPDNYLPITVVRDRLAVIQKEHPAEYEEGMKRFLNPPIPTYLNPYLRPGMAGYGSVGSTNVAPIAPAAGSVTTNTPALTSPTPPASTNVPAASAPTVK